MRHSLMRWVLGCVIAGASGLVAGACGSSGEGTAEGTDDEACAIGSEGCACTSGGTCDTGLLCLSEICVEDVGGSEAAGTSADTDTGETTSTTSDDTGETTDGDTGDTSDDGDTGAVCGPGGGPCDGTGDAAQAIGLCQGTPEVTVVGGDGSSGELAVVGGYGPTEGGQFWALGSGFVADLDGTPMGLDCSADVPGSNDPGFVLPDPIELDDVGNDCVEFPSLVGTGDCSNTVEGALNPTSDGALDYAELRIVVDVPDDANSLSVDLAFMSYEYPAYYGGLFNDFGIVWLESERWTGNIAFSNGYPLSALATDLFTALDADTSNPGPDGEPHPQCPADTGCTAPDLHDTCMQMHGATPWLVSRAPVEPGETITLVFAVIDVHDAVLDSYLLVDNLVWGCDDVGFPTTQIKP